jgi:NADPH:quinone reductase-like Zn-dependent oxidoreductase
MKATLIHSFGGAPVASIGNSASRDVWSHELRVRIQAASVNPLDLKIMAGSMQQVFPVELPYIPGTDFSGIVDAVGPQVSAFKRGDRIAGRSSPSAGGAFAEVLVIPASEACPIPAEMSFEQAAALPTAFGTASLALFRVGQLQAGQRVLIHGGSGGVGNFAVQLAKHAGAYAVATASSSNLEAVKSLGADEAIDYRSDDLARLKDFDLVLDTVGGETLERSWSVLRRGGRIATLVEFGIQPRDGRVGESVFFEHANESLPEAVKMFAAGQLQILIDSFFPLDQARAALEKVATGHARGKVLIRTTR